MTWAGCNTLRQWLTIQVPSACHVQTLSCVSLHPFHMLQPARGLIYSTGSSRSVWQHVQQDVMLIQPVFDSVTQHPKAILSSAVGWTGLEVATHKIKSTFSACLTSSGFCSASSSTSSYCPLLRTQAAVLSTGDIVAESTGDWTWSRDTCEHFKRNYIQIRSKIHFIWRRKMTMKLPVSKNPPNLLQRSFILPWLWTHNTYLSPSKSNVLRKFSFLSKRASLWESSCSQILFAFPLSPLPDFQWGFLNLWFLSQRKQSDKASLAACSGKTNRFIWSAEKLKVERLSQPGHRQTLQWRMGLRGLDTRWHSGTSKRCNIISVVPIRFKRPVEADTPKPGCERNPGPVVFTRSEKPHQRLSSL